ncbi:hypothetical protein GCM10010411_75140 [Actinomadura fulvescens]|uniref:Uncharacterized protein n=1 Tax=Actinomadura fulvescens TaxID=46160 RepID=A0ABP6CSQ9_9ACTN
MSRLFASVVDNVALDYGQFVLIDVAGAGESRESPWDLPGHDWIEVAPNGAMITGSGSSSAAIVRMELWDGPPTTEKTPNDWDRVRTVEFFTETGELHVAELMGEPGSEVLVLGRSSSRWNLRAQSSRNVGAIAAEEAEGIDEAFLFQFWPAD